MRPSCGLRFFFDLHTSHDFHALDHWALQPFRGWVHSETDAINAVANA